MAKLSGWGIREPRLGPDCENLCTPDPICTPRRPPPGHDQATVVNSPSSGHIPYPRTLRIPQLNPGVQGASLQYMGLAWLATVSANAALDYWHRNCDYAVGPLACDPRGSITSRVPRGPGGCPKQQLRHGGASGNESQCYSSSKNSIG
jgi:hypothetical protein